MRKPNKLDIIISLDVLCIYDLGQLSSQAISVLDIILRHIRNKNIYLGGLLIIFMMYHTQIKKWIHTPFLLHHN